MIYPIPELTVPTLRRARCVPDKPSQPGELTVNPGLAARLLGAAQALRERLGEPIAGPDLARHHDLIASVRQALGDPHYQAAWDQGRMMPEQQAIALAAATPAVQPRDDAAASSG